MEGLNNNFVESVIPLRAIKSAVEFQHSHENMDLLNSLTTSGSSIQYLGGDGQYHDFPESFYVDAFLLKYNNDAGNVTAAKDIDGNLYMQAENTFASELDNKVIGSIELERESDKQINVSIAEVDVNSGVVSENDLKYLTTGTGARLNFENGILSLDLNQSEAPFVNMMEKQVSAVVGDIGVFDAYGSVIDVGVSLSSLATSSQLATHAENTSLHVTSELQSTWNAKQAALTSGQLTATNSGITAAKVAQYDAYATNKQSVGGNLPNMNLVTDDNGNITTAAPFVPSTKINTVPTAVQNRVATFTSDGNVKDSGIILGAFSSNETVKEYLDNAVSSSITGSSYQGTFTYFGTQVQVESVSTAVAGDTAIVYLGSITNLEGLLRGDYNGSTWAFADVSPAPSNGAWMETDKLLGNDPVVPGRIIVKMDGVNPPALDVRPNTTMQLDNVTIGLNSAGRVSLVMKMLSSGKSVMNTIISDSIAYEFTNTGGTDTSKTIKEVIDENKAAAEPVFTKNTAFNKNFDTSSQSATSTMVIGNNDTRLTNSRPASDVYAWAKEATKPTYTYSEVGALGVDKVVQSQSTAVDTVPCSALLRNSSFACVYRALTELSGISTSSTIAQVCEAMVDNSVLIASTSEYTNLLPTGETDSNGLLEITRVNLNRVKLFWSYSNASRQPIYVGEYRNSVGFSGWKQIFTADNISTTMPISSVAARHTKTMSEKLEYDQFALKAPLDSPNFTGSPTAPTPTISTGIANKAYVDSEISTLTLLNTVSAVTTTGNPVNIQNTNEGFVDKVKILNDTASAISSPLTGKSVGKNLVNIANHNITFTNSNCIDTNYYYILKPSTKYSIRFDYVINSTTATKLTYSIGYGATSYQADIVHVAYTNLTSGTILRTFTTPATFSYEPNLFVREVRSFTAQAISVNANISNIQLNLGDTLPYEPYTETAFSIPLKDTSGNTLSLNPADVIEMIDGKYCLGETELHDDSQDALRSIPTYEGQTNLIGNQPFTFDITEFQLGLESIDAMLTLPNGTRVNVLTKDRMVYITSGEYKGKTLDYVLRKLKNEIERLGTRDITGSLFVVHSLTKKHPYSATYFALGSWVYQGYPVKHLKDKNTGEPIYDKSRMRFYMKEMTNSEYLPVFGDEIYFYENNGVDIQKIYKVQLQELTQGSGELLCFFELGTPAEIFNLPDKETTLTKDTTVGEGVKIYAVDNSGNQTMLSIDDTPTSGSSNPVTSEGIKTALDGKQNTLTFDDTPTSGSNNPVTSGGIKTAIDNMTLASVPDGSINGSKLYPRALPQKLRNTFNYSANTVFRVSDITFGSGSFTVVFTTQVSLKNATDSGSIFRKYFNKDTGNLEQIKVDFLESTGLPQGLPIHISYNSNMRTYNIQSFGGLYIAHILLGVFATGKENDLTFSSSTAGKAYIYESYGSY